MQDRVDPNAMQPNAANRNQSENQEKESLTPQRQRDVKKDIALYRLEDGKPEDIGKKAGRELPKGITPGMMYKDVVQIAWPAFIELMLTQLTAMADQMMVGSLGSWATSAVGLSTQPKFLMSTMFIALNVGAMAMVARHKGAGRQDKAKLILRQALMLNLVFSLLCSALGIIFCEPMVRFMTGGDAISEVAVRGGITYLNIQFVGLFGLALTSTITNCLRGAGDSRTAMIYNTTANVVNVVFNYLLIYGRLGFPRMEVAGASLATIIGQFVALGMALAAVLRKGKYLRLEFPRGWAKPDGESIREMAKIGLPSMVEQIFMRVGMVIYARLVAGLGDVAYATHTICMNIQALTFMNGQAFAVSATSLVGQSLGKIRSDMAEHYARFTRRVGQIVAFVIAAGVFFGGRWIILLYNNTEPEIAQVGAIILRIVALTQPFQAAQFILSGALRGAGDTRYTAMVIAISVMVVRPLVAYICINPIGLGLYGAWIALIVDQLLRTLLIWLRFNSGKWKEVIRTRPGKAAA